MSFLTYQSLHLLPRNGQCSLLGVGANGTVFIEIFYDDAWIAWYGLRADGSITMNDDEQSGSNPQFQLPTAEIKATPEPVSPSHPLNFSGPRLRGDRQSERVADLVYPLDVATKIRCIETFKLPLTPMQLLGIAESTVLSMATLNSDGLQVVCRRIRLTYTLPAALTDTNGEPYDYDTISICCAHLYHPDENQEFVSDSLFDGLPGPSLTEPTDCMVTARQLLITKSSGDDEPCQLYVWTVHPE